MSDKKVNHDATASTRGTLHQLWVAVEKCFEMHKAGHKIFIETQGDVSGEDQIEVKRYSDKLTDNHLCFWKTLRNWTHPDFDPIQYKSLILLTTQEFGSSATISNWNNESINNRLGIIQSIYEQNKTKYEARCNDEGEKKPTESFKLQQIVFSKGKRDKLIAVLERFFIEALAPHTPELYDRIKGKYLKGVLEGKKDDFLKSLFGYISQPTNNSSESWVISFEEFEKKVQELTKIYCHGTTIFPPINREMPEANIDECAGKYLFVRKILDIEYQAVLRKAIEHYQIALQTVNYEFRSYLVPLKRTEQYSQEIVDQFEAKYRIAARNCTDTIQDSQNLYDDVTGSVPAIFPSFNSTPLSFRNGILHSEMNDEDKGLEWRVDENE